MGAETIVIVGAGQAGGWAAKTLRAEGHAGRVVLIGAERHPSHERPPLSKAVLAGEAHPDTTHLFKPAEHDALESRLPRQRARHRDRPVGEARDARGRETPLRTTS